MERERVNSEVLCAGIHKMKLKGKIMLCVRVPDSTTSPEEPSSNLLY